VDGVADKTGTRYLATPFRGGSWSSQPGRHAAGSESGINIVAPSLSDYYQPPHLWPAALAIPDGDEHRPARNEIGVANTSLSQNARPARARRRNLKRHGGNVAKPEALSVLEEYAMRLVSKEAVHLREMELMLMKRAPD
jgi:hypothetical protein